MKTKFAAIYFAKFRVQSFSVFLVKQNIHQTNWFNYCQNSIKFNTILTNTSFGSSSPSGPTTDDIEGASDFFFDN